MPNINLQAFALRLLRGACNCAVLGDSINLDYATGWTTMKYGYERELTPTAWAGVTSSCGLGGTVDMEGTTGTVDTVGMNGGFGGTAILDGAGGGVSGEADRWPTQYSNYRSAGNIGGGSTITNVQYTATRRAGFAAGDPFTGAGTFRICLNRGTVGIASVGMFTLRGGGSFQAVDPIPLALGYNYADVPVAAGVGDIVAQVVGSSAANDETGQNLYYMNQRFKATGVTGLTLGCLGVGGLAVDGLNNVVYYTDAAITAYVTAFDTDTIIINIGTNDSTWGPIQYAHLLSAISRWRSAIVALGRTFKCLLISPYAQSARSYPDVAAYMAQACGTNSDISFYDQAAVTPNYATMNATYLVDGVHPNTTGSVYLARLLNNALLAALSAGTSGGASGIGTPSSFVRRRRARARAA